MRETRNRAVTRGAVLILAAALALARAADAGHGGVPAVALTEPEYLKWLIDSRQPVVVVDLRSPPDFRRGHLPGAVSVPLAELDRRFAEIPTQPMVVLYCRCPLEGQPPPTASSRPRATRITWSCRRATTAGSSVVTLLTRSPIRVT
jgi:hypothetical protein